jgi:DNA-binding transcriptional ArsR family regulator
VDRLPITELVMKGQERRWTLFTSHGLILLTVARQPASSIASIVAATGLGRSTVLNVLSDLRRGEMVTVHKRGRRNTYEINQSALLRHPSLSEHKVGDLLRAFFGHRKKVAPRSC